MVTLCDLCVLRGESLFLSFSDGVEFTDIVADAALDTLRRIDPVRLFDLSGNRLLRALPEAAVAARAQVLQDGVGNQFLANSRRAAVLPDMRLVLITETAQGGRDRIGSGLAEGA